MRTEVAPGDCLAEVVSAAQAGDVVRVAYAGGDVWMVCEPELARATLADPRLYKRPEFAPAWLVGPGGLIGSRQATAAAQMIISDGAAHARIRGLHRDVFSTRRIAEWSGRIERIVNEQLDLLDPEGPVDLVHGLAYPLPLRMVCAILGLPERVQPVLRQATEDILLSADPAVVGKGIETMFGCVAACVTQPGDLAPGLVTTLLEHTTGDAPAVTVTEVITWTVGLVLAGHESTASLLSSALFEALRRPEQQRPRTERELTEWVEETLRVHPPFPVSTFRFTSEGTELGGYVIPAESVIMVNLAAGNVDSGPCSSAGFSVGSGNARHLTFGAGPHFCLGAALARLETTVALRVFFGRFRHARLAAPADPDWQSSLALRRLRRLDVLLNPLLDTDDHRHRAVQTLNIGLSEPAASSGSPHR